MIWRTLDSPMICALCHVEQPTGAQMAEYALGPVIRYNRCVSCERDVANGSASIRRIKAASLRASVALEEAIFGESKSHGFTQAAIAYDSLPAEVKARHERATGEQ